MKVGEKGVKQQIQRILEKWIIWIPYSQVLDQYRDSIDHACW